MSAHKLPNVQCECSEPATVVLRGAAQCARCAAIEKTLYPIGWAGMEAKKHNPKHTMKKTLTPFLLSAFCFLLFLCGCRAQTVLLTWNPVTVGSPTGYRVYSMLPGTTNWNVLATPTNTYHAIPFTNSVWGERYCVTALRDTQESPPSNVITNLIPRSPENMRLNHNIALPQ